MQTSISITRNIRQILSLSNVIFFVIVFFSLSLLQFIQQHIIDLSFYRTLVQQHEYWRLLTGGLVHANTTHLTLNLLGVFCLLMLYEHQIKTIYWCSISITLVICVNISIFLWIPSTEHYLGFSGASHGLYAWYSIKEWKRKHSLFPIFILLFLLGKMIIDAFSINQLSSTLIGMRVHWQSHWIGAIAGTLIAFISKKKAA